MLSNHGWGRPVPGDVRGPGVIESSIILVRQLILGITNAFYFLVPDSGMTSLAMIQ